jgi:hypothetical protein
MQLDARVSARRRVGAPRMRVHAAASVWTLLDIFITHATNAIKFSTTTRFPYVTARKR